MASLALLDKVSWSHEGRRSVVDMLMVPFNSAALVNKTVDVVTSGVSIVWQRSHLNDEEGSLSKYALKQNKLIDKGLGW